MKYTPQILTIALQRVDLLGLLLEATDRLTQAADERDEARKAARSICSAVLSEEFPRYEIVSESMAKWLWLTEGTACDKCGKPVPIDRDAYPEGIVWCRECAAKEME